MVGVIALVVGFQSSNGLAGAYGIAVTGTMASTTVLAMIVGAARLASGAGSPSSLVFGALLAVDLAVLRGDAAEDPERRLVPAGRRGGRLRRHGHLAARPLPSSTRCSMARRCRSTASSSGSSRPRCDVARTAIFMTNDPNSVPRAMLHNMKHNMVLHERIIMMTVVPEDVPHVPPRSAGRRSTGSGKGFFRVTARFGYMDDPDVHAGARSSAASTASPPT